MHRPFANIIRAGAILAAMSTAVYGATIVVTDIDTAHGESGLWMNENGTDTQQYFVGNLFIRLTVGTTTYNRTAYCVDLFTDISLNITYNTVVEHPYDDPNLLSKHLDRVSWLIENYASKVSSAVQGAALQLAIWDIVHNNGDGFTTGTVQQGKTHATLPSNIITQAINYETLSYGQSSNGAFVYRNSTSGGVAAQMLMGPVFNDGGPQPTPEPGTWLMVAGAAAAWKIRRIWRDILVE